MLAIAAVFLANGASEPGLSSSSPAVLPPVTVAAPQSSDARTVSTCANVISALPLVLSGQNLRRTVSDPPSPSIVAWGDPAIVLRCGVSRPADLKPNSGAQYVTGGVRTGPYYDVTQHGDANVWTTVDRAVYIEITVPVTYNSAPLTPISQAIAKVLKPVCEPQSSSGPLVPANRLCTHRS